jgi:hypothetical protein
MSETEPDPEDAANWEEACRREDAIRKFVLHRDGNRKSATVKELARELGLSRACHVALNRETPQLSIFNQLSLHCF